MRNIAFLVDNTENLVICPTSLSVDAAELLERLGVESVEVEPVQDVEDALVVVVSPNLAKDSTDPLHILLQKVELKHHS